MTVTTDSMPAPDAPDRPMVRTYILVLVVEAVVLAGLWMFSRYFS
jgi:hypothetical protein